MLHNALEIPADLFDSCSLSAHTPSAGTSRSINQTPLQRMSVYSLLESEGHCWSVFRQSEEETQCFHSKVKEDISQLQRLLQRSSTASRLQTFWSWTFSHCLFLNYQVSDNRNCTTAENDVNSPLCCLNCVLQVNPSWRWCLSFWVSWRCRTVGWVTDNTAITINDFDISGYSSNYWWTQLCPN